MRKNHRGAALFVGITAGLFLAAMVCCVPAATLGGNTGGGAIAPPTGSGSLNQNRNRNTNRNQNSPEGPPGPGNGNANQPSNANGSTNGNSNGSVGPPPPGGNQNSANLNGGNVNSNGSQNGNSTSANCNLNCSGVNTTGLVAPDLGPLVNETILAGDSYRSDPVPVIRGTRPFAFAFLQAPGGLRFLGERIRWDAPVAGFAPCVVELQACNCAGADTVRFTLEVLEEDFVTFRRVSIGTNCTAPTREATDGAISDDGNFIVYQSDATDIVPNDTNDTNDIFLVNRRSGELRRISVNNAGVPTAVSEPSLRPRISADGTAVAFQSFGTTLTDNDTNAGADVFVYAVASPSLVAVSRNTAGELGNASSEEPVLSANGQVIAFTSSATNLSPDDTNVLSDIFVHDRSTSVTTRVSVSSAGVQADGGSSQPALSNDGRFVAFTSTATNLVADDLNALPDIFVHDRQTGETIRASVDSAGAEANGASANAGIGGAGNELVVFESTASNLAGLDANGTSDVFVRNRTAGTTAIVSVNPGGVISGNAVSQSAQITPNGRWVVFQSNASDLIADDFNALFDIYLRDLTTNSTTLVTRTDEGGQSDGPSSRPRITADGQFVVFDTKATTLVLSDLDPLGDVIVRDLTP